VANTTAAARTATLTIGGQTFTVSQGAASDVVTLGSTSLQVGYAGATNSVSVFCTDGCSWSARVDSVWVTVTPGQGAGPGSVKVVVAPNDTANPRAATVTIGDKALRVNQDGKPRPNTPKGLRIVPKPKK
jgi:hypothetical protein